MLIYYHVAWIAIVVIISIILCVIRSRRAARFAAMPKPQTIIVEQQVPMQPYPGMNPDPNNSYYAPQPGYNPATFQPPLGDPTMQQYQYQQPYPPQTYPPQPYPPQPYAPESSPRPQQYQYPAPQQAPSSPYQAGQPYYGAPQPAPPVSSAAVFSPPPVYSAADPKSNSGQYDKSPELSHHIVGTSGESSINTASTPSQPRPPQGPQAY